MYVCGVCECVCVCQSVCVCMCVCCICKLIKYDLIYNKRETYS